MKSLRQRHKGAYIWQQTTTITMEQLISKSSPYFFPLSVGFTVLVLILSIVFTYKKMQNKQSPKPKTEKKTGKDAVKNSKESPSTEEDLRGGTLSLSLSLNG